jgi:arsenite methyltransferase
MNDLSSRNSAVVKIIKRQTLSRETLANLAKALGHPARVAIVQFLLEQRACVCGQIVDSLPLAQSTVSQHLKKLREADWIQGEVEGPRTCYCINPAAIQKFFRLSRQLFSPLMENISMDTPDDIRTTVRERYAEAAKNSGSLCGCGSCCGGAVDVDAISRQVGYTLEELKILPEGANLGLGCGNPIEHANLKAGETVLDLGSGAGIDCFLAARAVGEQGRVIGVDMTPAMIEKARANLKAVGVKNVEFRLGEIEHLPLADASVDVIISNCVVNLSPDKPQVFREALRVLKSGGRLMISDLVLRLPLSDKLRTSVEAYVGCVAGASMKDDYLTLMREAGFTDVTIVDEHLYDVGIEALGKELQKEALDAVVSVKVRAVKA